MEILKYIELHWIEWLFAVLFFFVGVAYRYLYKRMIKQKTEHDEKIEIERKKNDAIMEGIQAMLRQTIIDKYNKYQDYGFCPIYAKDSIGRVYEAYHALGGNDVGTSLYHKLLEMPEEKEGE